MPTYNTETRYDSNGQPYQVRIASKTPNELAQERADAAGQKPVEAGKANPNYKDWSLPENGGSGAPPGTTAIAERPGYAQEAANAANALDIDFTQDEEAAAREEVRRQKQAQVDAINKIYDEMLTEEQQTGVERSGRSKAIASRAGILETPMGSAQLTKTEQFNAQQQKLLQAEREAKIVAIEDKMNTRLDEKIKAERELAGKNYDKYQDFLKEQATEGENDLVGIAKSGTQTLDMFKTSDFYKQIKQETGFSDMKLDYLFNANLPKEWQFNELFKTQYKGENGNQWLKKIVIDPATGQQKELNYDLGVPFKETEEIKEVEGMPYKVIKDAEGKVVRYEAIPGIVKKPKAEDIVTSGGLKISKSEVGELGKTLKQNAGSDGYVNTAEYLQGLKNWIDLNGLAKDYYANFLPKDYLNPADPTIPQNIKNLLKYDEVQALINALGG